MTLCTDRPFQPSLGIALRSLVISIGSFAVLACTSLPSPDGESAAHLRDAVPDTGQVDDASRQRLPPAEEHSEATETGARGDAGGGAGRGRQRARSSRRRATRTGRRVGRRRSPGRGGAGRGRQRARSSRRRATRTGRRVGRRRSPGGGGTGRGRQRARSSRRRAARTGRTLTHTAIGGAREPTSSGGSRMPGRTRGRQPTSDF